MKHDFEGHSILELEMLRDVPVGNPKQNELSGLLTPSIPHTGHQLVGEA